MNNFESKIKPSLIEKHQAVTEEEIAVFKRKWEVRVLLPLISSAAAHAKFGYSTISDTARPASLARLWAM